MNYQAGVRPEMQHRAHQVSSQEHPVCWELPWQAEVGFHAGTNRNVSSSSALNKNRFHHDAITLLPYIDTLVSLALDLSTAICFMGAFLK